MFGYVSVDVSELSEEEKLRYNSVYCGICRNIRSQSSNVARLALSYDMAFLALLLTSLYEPEEAAGPSACMLHPIKKKPWVDNEYIRYAADMNVALAYYNCLDDWRDDGKLTARAAAALLGTSYPRIKERYPRQCAAIENCISRLSALEKANCPNPDEPAGCFGALMAELMVYHEDLWSDDLRGLGYALGRFIYLADAAADYRSDLKKNKYNPYIAMDCGEDRSRWEQYLLLAMGRCTEHFERLPLVQDKNLLDKILYSGVWVEVKRKMREEEHDPGSL